MKTKSNKLLIWSIVLLAVCFAVAVGFMIVFLRVSEGYKNTLENRYQKSYLQLIDNVDDIEVDLSKLVATTSFESQKTIMQNIYTNCVLASENLGSLPLGSESLNNVNMLINKVGGYILSFINSGSGIEGDSLKSIEGLHRSVSVLKYDLNKGYSDLLGGDVMLTDSVYADGESSFTAGLMNGKESYGDIPTLIYDGPFSETVLNKEPKVLEEEVSQAEASKKVEVMLDYFEGYTLKYDGVTNGKLSTYNFILSNDESAVYVQVLKNGGKLLSATSKGVFDGDVIDVDSAIEIAKEIAYTFGFLDMVSVWHQALDNVVYINLAPMIDGVIYYSDLVKIKISLSGGTLLGFEGSAYIYNHYERPEYSNKVSLMEGQLLLSEGLGVLERNYCVVPNEYVGESNALEYVCEWSGYTYYVYLDAATGAELKIMRVIETENGDLLG